MTRYAWKAWGIVVFVIPFVLYYDYVLNAFYHYGALSGDGGLFAHLIWHGDWRMSTPSFHTRESFYTQHFSPFLLFFSQLSYFVPSYRAEYYAAFLGTMYAAIGLVLFYMFSLCVKPRNHWQMAGLAVAACAFSFNGVVTNGLVYLHMEYALPLGTLLFLISLVRGQRLLSIFFFVLTLSIREDAGVHLGAILTLLTLLRYAKYRSFAAIKWEAVFLALAAVYTLCAFGVIRYFCAQYGHEPEMFSTIYSGFPPYAHLSWQLLSERARIMLHNRTYIWLPALLSLVWGIILRDLYLPLGFIAYVPWLILGWTAKYDMAGTLGIYYGFPFLFSLAWPLVAVMWRYGFPLPQPAVRRALALQIVFICIGLVSWDDNDGLKFGPTYNASWGGYRLQEGAQNRELVRNFVMKLDAGAGDLGKVMVDEHIFSLIEGKYQGQPIGNLLEVQANKTQPVIDTLLYLDVFNTASDETLLDLVSHNHLSHNYCIAGAPLCMFTNRTEQQIEPYSSLLMKVPVGATRKK